MEDLFHRILELTHQGIRAESSLNPSTTPTKINQISRSQEPTARREEEIEQTKSRTSTSPRPSTWTTLPNTPFIKNNKFLKECPTQSTPNAPASTKWALKETRGGTWIFRSKTKHKLKHNNRFKMTALPDQAMLFSWALDYPSASTKLPSSPGKRSNEIRGRILTNNNLTWSNKSQLLQRWANLITINTKARSKNQPSILRIDSLQFNFEII